MSDSEEEGEIVKESGVGELSHACVGDGKHRKGVEAMGREGKQRKGMGKREERMGRAEKVRGSEGKGREGKS